MKSPDPIPSDPLEGEILAAAERDWEADVRRASAIVTPEEERAARESMLVLLRRSAGGRRRALLPASLAAAFLAALALATWFARRQDEPSVPLGTGGVRVLAPVGASPELSAFAWEGELPEGASFELRIWEAEADGGPLVFRTLETRAWTVPPEITLPVRIRWEVRVVDALSETLSSDEARAWRSP